MWWWVYEVCKAGKSQSTLLCTPHIIQKITQKMSDHKGEGEQRMDVFCRKIICQIVRSV